MISNEYENALILIGVVCAPCESEANFIFECVRSFWSWCFKGECQVFCTQTILPNRTKPKRNNNNNQKQKQQNIINEEKRLNLPIRK